MNDLYDAPANDGDDVSIQDPDDLHRIRRVEAIHDARDTVVEVLLKCREREMTDRFFTSADTDRYAILTALNYLRELEPMIRRSESDLLEREITIRERSVSPEHVPSDGMALSSRSVTVGPLTVSLDELLDSGGSVSVSTSARGKDPFSGIKKRREFSVKLRPKTKHALRIVRLCDDFIEEILPSITSGDGEADFDYSDLL
jgi:hypothetical protein